MSSSGIGFRVRVIENRGVEVGVGRVGVGVVFVVEVGDRVGVKG